MHVLKAFIEKLPIPTAGLALGIAALGNLLKPYSLLAYGALGCLAAVLILLLAAKLFMFPHLIKDDMKNSILASVSCTFYMASMQLATYLAQFFYTPALVLWGVALVAQLTHMLVFFISYFKKFKLEEVFPTYFIAFVGIIVASATSPTFGLQDLGLGIFWLGFLLYIPAFILVTLRYRKLEVPQAATPLICIYAAPMSLSITGYLACTHEVNLVFLGTLMILAQILLAFVVVRVPKFFKLDFYPSLAAMTFPFVVAATAFNKSCATFVSQGFELWSGFFALGFAETLFASCMVAYTCWRYGRFFITTWQNLHASRSTFAQD